MADDAQDNGPPIDTGGLAADLAIEEARKDPSLRAHVAAFLDDQRALIADQRHHLREQFKQVHLSVWEKQLGVLLRLATAVVGIAFASAIGVMVWDAAHSNGLVIEPFAMPPDMTAKGLSGEVAAGQLLDKLTQMQNATTSGRPAQSYSTNWGGDLKVEIPETGISLGEFRRFLREWLGNDTHISGEVWHTPTGIAITARAGGKSGEAIAGTEEDFNLLIQKAAEQVYASTQPYRYANYLDRDFSNPNIVQRVAQAEAIYKRLIYDRDPVERAWAWNGLGTIAYSAHGNIPEAIRYYDKALAVQPDLAIAYAALLSQHGALGHAQVALGYAQRYREIVQANSPSERAVDVANGTLANMLGDYAESARLCIKAAGLPNTQSVQNHDTFQDCAAQSLALQHDVFATRAWIRDMPPVEVPLNNGRRANSRLRVATALEDWRTVAATEPAAEQAMITWMPGFDRITLRIYLRPQLAMAKAKLGDIAGAEALIAPTPGDCYHCTYIRGQIAEMAKQPDKADYWFAKAVQDAPSIPFAYHEWGKVLLARGKPDAAIEKFTQANEKGPHFADALEGWGEALMARNQSHLALAKFAEAEKDAPNWGRLHLKWGQALLYAGKRDEARKQFARAAQLDLTPSEKAELEKSNRI
ncbi:MAG TPA: tetratricopeptide repeat protein [Rhizomicrobium sp.]|nr:tetratricopeptide repeat protein [Rhizomicrobium sp.]